MATHHVTVTLGSGPTPILKPPTGVPTTNCMELQLESAVGNDQVYVGGPDVSPTDYGISLTPQATIRTPGVWNINLANMYLIGTPGQKVHALYHT